MASSLADYAIDLINDAKSTPDSSKKIYYLEQVKEIVLFRETGLLMELLPSMLDFMIEKNSDLKKFLLTLSYEVLQRSLTALPLILNLYSHVLIGDNADSVVRKVCTDMKFFYEKIIMYIAQLPPIKPKAILSATVVDPKQLWNQFREVVGGVIELASSNKRDGVKIAALKVIESVILFGLSPSETTTTAAKPLDPRLQRAAAAVSAGSGTTATPGNELTASAIPLHHPFISRDELMVEAEDLFSKLLLWASKGGPQGKQFSPEVISNLGQSLATITTARPKLIGKATVAIVFVMQGKGNVCSLMTGSAREQLARSVHRLIRGLSGKKEETTNVAKLRSAVESLEKLGFGGDTSETIGGDRKRSRDEMQSSDTLAEDELDEEQQKLIRDRALADLNAADKSFAKTSTVAAGNAMGAVSKGSTAMTIDADGTLSGSAASTTSSINTSHETELLTSIAEIKTSFSSGMKMLVVTTSQLSSKSASTALTTTNAAVNVIQLKPSSSVPAAESYSLLSFESVLRLLSSFDEQLSHNFSAVADQKASMLRVLIERTVMTQSSMELTTNDGRGNQLISLFASLPSPTALGKLMEGLSNDVHITSALWVLISYVLGSRKIRDDDMGTKTWQGYHRLLHGCMVELFRRSIIQEDSQNDFDQACSSKLYDSCCLAIIARLLAMPQAKLFLREFVGNLPCIPDSSLKLLRLLVHTGSKMISSKDKSGIAEKDKEKVKSVRLEALGLLVLATSSVHEETATFALNILLWLAVDDDFEIRYKTIASLISEVFVQHDWALHSATKFSLQVIVSIFGVDEIKKYHPTVPVVDESDKMILEDESHREQSAVQSIFLAAESFQNGKDFNGIFNRMPTGVGSKVEAYFKRHLHLFSQIVTLPGMFRLLSVYFEMNAIAIRSRKVSDSGVNAIAMEEETASGTNASSVVTTEKHESPMQTLIKLIRSDISAVVPAIVKNEEPVVVFTGLIESPYFASSFELCEHFISNLQTDIQLPASNDMILAVKQFVRQQLESGRMLTSGTIDNEDDMLELFEVETNASQPWIQDGIDYRYGKAVRLLVPVVSAMPASEIEAIFPYVIRALGHSVEMCKSFIDRLVKCRPPPLSRSAVAILLHRIDPESKAVCFKPRTPADRQKIVNNCIKICIEAESEFTADVWKDTLGKLLEDTTIVNIFMRTVILSFNTHPELRKYVLAEVLPALIRKRVWISAKSVWEGVLIAMKSLAGHRDAEPSLRAVLTLPGAQLLSFLRFKEIKTVLGKLWKSLAASERSEITSSVVGVGEEGSFMHEDKVKAKLLDELLES